MTPNEIAINTANKFMDTPEFVSICEDKINELAETIKKIYPKSTPWPTPDIFSKDPKIANAQIILYELIASSVNYKYWYGKPNVRPNESNAIKMYLILNKTFQNTATYDDFTDAYCEYIIENFMRYLIEERFPMISERINHLKELLEPVEWSPAESNQKAAHFSRWMRKEIEIAEIEKPSLNTWMSELLTYFPGFAQDIFLKRANLFFMQLYRRKEWFKDDINKLIIPADYHIPNVLRHFGCINYNPKIRLDIHEYKLIPEGSLLECEIRAASIIAGEIMKEKDINPVQLDDYLWNNRKEPKEPFHLTITTNY